MNRLVLHCYDVVCVQSGWWGVIDRECTAPAAMFLTREAALSVAHHQARKRYEQGGGPTAVRTEGLSGDLRHISTYADVEVLAALGTGAAYTFVAADFSAQDTAASR